MSTALAIAGVSAVLRDLLNDRFINQDIGSDLGQSVTVTTLPPDRVSTGEGTEPSQLNVFLMRVTPNLGWRNEGLPSRDGLGRRLSKAPLALNLHYLISAYGSTPLHPEILLGHAMQLLHENAVISRVAIRRALQISPGIDPGVPPELRALASSGLEDQIEQLKISPEYLDAEELSKLWTACQSRFRLSAGYRVSVILIEPDEPTVAPLPVLSRNVQVNPDVLPPLPTLDAVVPAAGQPVVQLGTIVKVEGHHLAGTQRKVRLTNDRFSIDETLDAEPGDSETEMQFSIPTTRADDFPVGVYRVAAQVQPSGALVPQPTNQLAMTLAPHIIGLPQSVHPITGTATFTLDFHPTLRAGQTVSLLLGSQPFAPQPFTPPVAALSFLIPNAPVANHLARLRIDGIDSPIVDRSTLPPDPPVFLNQRIDIQ